MTDHLGTVRDLATFDDQTQTTEVANHLIYDAFGNFTTETAAAVDHLFAFTGRPFDEMTGLQNNLNRWYDATTGRWLSEDPIGFDAGDGNLYRYVGNEPLEATDPAGLAASLREDILAIQESYEQQHRYLRDKAWRDIRRVIAEWETQSPYFRKLAATQFLKELDEFVAAAGDSQRHSDAVRLMRLGQSVHYQDTRDQWLYLSATEEVMRDMTTQIPLGVYRSAVSGVLNSPAVRRAEPGSAFAEDASLAISFIPLVGDAMHIQEAATGRSLIESRNLTTGERAVTTIAVFVPIWSGRAGREILGEAAEVAGERLLRAGAAEAPSKVPNPYGRLGSPAHRAKVDQVIQDITSRSLKPVREMPVKTVNGQKATRYMDVGAIDPKTGQILEVHQVGRTLKTKPKIPVARERAALRDVRHSPELRGAKRIYHGF